MLFDFSPGESLDAASGFALLAYGAWLWKARSHAAWAPSLSLFFAGWGLASVAGNVELLVDWSHPAAAGVVFFAADWVTVVAAACGMAGLAGFATRFPRRLERREGASWMFLTLLAASATTFAFLYTITKRQNGIVWLPGELLFHLQLPAFLFVLMVFALRFVKAQGARALDERAFYALFAFPLSLWPAVGASVPLSLEGAIQWLGFLGALQLASCLWMSMTWLRGTSIGRPASRWARNMAWLMLASPSIGLLLPGLVGTLTGDGGGAAGAMRLLTVPAFEFARRKYESFGASIASSPA